MALPFGLTLAKLGAACTSLSQVTELAASHGDKNKESSILCKQINREMKEAEKVLAYTIILKGKELSNEIEEFPPLYQTQVVSLMQAIEDCKTELLERSKSWCTCAAGCAVICGGGSTVKSLKLLYQELSQRVARCTGPVEALVKQDPQYYVAVEFQQARRILVYGEVGTGKSTIIQELTGLTEDEIKTGLAHRGVTKEISLFYFRLNGHLMCVVDCPGAGDRDVPIGVVVDRLSDKFDQQQGKFPGRFSAVIFAKTASEPRFQMGAQFVSKVLGLSFGADKQAWGKHALIVGTKADTINADEQSMYKETLQHCARDFMTEAGAEIPENFNKQQVILKHKGDVEGLSKALLRIIEHGGEDLNFTKPKEDDIFDAFYQVHGAGQTRTEIENQFREEFQRPRQTDCVKRAQVAINDGNLQELTDHVNFLQVLHNDADADDDIKEKLKNLQSIRDDWKQSVADMESSLDLLIQRSKDATDNMTGLSKQATEMNPTPLGLLKERKVGARVRRAKENLVLWFGEEGNETMFGTVVDKDVGPGNACVQWKDGTCMTHRVGHGGKYDLEEIALMFPALHEAEMELNVLQDEYERVRKKAGQVPYKTDHNVQSKLQMLESVMKGQENSLHWQQQAAQQQQEMLFQLNKKDKESLGWWKRITASEAELRNMKRENQQLVYDKAWQQAELDRMRRERSSQLHQGHLKTLKAGVDSIGSPLGTKRVGVTKAGHGVR